MRQFTRIELALIQSALCDRIYPNNIERFNQNEATQLTYA